MEFGLPQEASPYYTDVIPVCKAGSNMRTSPLLVPTVWHLKTCGRLQRRENVSLEIGEWNWGSKNIYFGRPQKIFDRASNQTI